MAEVTNTSPPGAKGTKGSGNQADKLRTAGSAAQQGTGNRPVGSSEQSCPSKDTTWIEIELVGEDDTGIADAAYLIVTADGKEFRGKTDANGLARLVGLCHGGLQSRLPAFGSGSVGEI
jgi:hypothetical protein